MYYFQRVALATGNIHLPCSCQYLTNVMYATELRRVLGVIKTPEMSYNMWHKAHVLKVTKCQLFYSFFNLPYMRSTDKSQISWHFKSLNHNRNLTKVLGESSGHTCAGSDRPGGVNVNKRTVTKYSYSLL